MVSFIIKFIALSIAFGSISCSGNPVAEPVHPDDQQKNDQTVNSKKSPDKDLEDKNPDPDQQASKDSDKSQKQIQKSDDHQLNDHAFLKIDIVMDVSKITEKMHDFLLVNQDPKIDFCSYTRSVMDKTLFNHIDYSDGFYPYGDHQLNIKVLTNLFHRLDPYKIFFYQDDLDFFAKSLGVSFVENIWNNDCSGLILLGYIYSKRIDEYIKISWNYAKQSFITEDLFYSFNNYEIHQQYIGKFPRNLEKRKHNIKQLIQYFRHLIAFNFVREQGWEKHHIIRQLMANVRFQHTLYKNINIKTLYNSFLSGFLSSLDYHSRYFDTDTTTTLSLQQGGLWASPTFDYSITKAGIIYSPKDDPSSLTKKPTFIQQGDLITGVILTEDDYFTDQDILKDQDKPKLLDISQLGYYGLRHLTSGPLGSKLKLSILTKKDHSEISYRQKYITVDRSKPYFTNSTHSFGVTRNSQFVDLDYFKINHSKPNPSFFSPDYEKKFGLGVITIDRFAQPTINPLGELTPSTSIQIKQQISQLLEEIIHPDSNYPLSHYLSGLVLDLRFNDIFFRDDYQEMLEVLSLFVSETNAMIVEYPQLDITIDQQDLTTFGNKKYKVQGIARKASSIEDQDKSSYDLEMLLQKIPVILWVSSQTSGIGELFAQSLKLHQRAIIVGDSDTSGMGGVLTKKFVERSDQGELIGSFYLTIGKIYGIDGKSIYKKGLTPDIHLSSKIEFSSPSINKHSSFLSVKDIETADVDYRIYHHVNDDKIANLQKLSQWRIWSSSRFLALDRLHKKRLNIANDKLDSIYYDQYPDDVKLINEPYDSELFDLIGETSRVSDDFILEELLQIMMDYSSLIIE